MYNSEVTIVNNAILFESCQESTDLKSPHHKEKKNL